MVKTVFAKYRRKFDGYFSRFKDKDFKLFCHDVLIQPEEIIRPAGKYLQWQLSRTDTVSR